MFKGPEVEGCLVMSRVYKKASLSGSENRENVSEAGKISVDLILKDLKVPKTSIKIFVFLLGQQEAKSIF